MTKRPTKGWLILLCSLVGCVPQKPADQLAQGVATDRGIAVSQETAKDNMAASIPNSALDNRRFTPYTGEPPVINFFGHLGFERPSHSAIKIWGWSKDGKVAYSDHLSHEGSVFRAYILDFIDDRVVWQDGLDFYSLHLNEAYEQSDNWFNNKFYLDFIDNFKAVCAQNRIEFVQTEFKGLPIRHNNQSVDIILEKNASTLDWQEREELFIVAGYYDNYKIIAENSGRRKTVHEKKFTTVYADDVFVCGYFLSPFEDRALIVIGEFAHSFEGSDVTYHFAGCHLTLGF